MIHVGACRRGCVVVKLNVTHYTEEQVLLNQASLNRLPLPPSICVARLLFDIHLHAAVQTQRRWKPNRPCSWRAQCDSASVFVCRRARAGIFVHVTTHSTSCTDPLRSCLQWPWKQVSTTSVRHVLCPPYAARLLSFSSSSSPQPHFTTEISVVKLDVCLD